MNPAGAPFLESASKAPEIKVHANTEVEMEWDIEDIVDDMVIEADESVRNVDMSELPHIQNVFTV